jgi:5'-3' exonuclease
MVVTVSAKDNVMFVDTSYFVFYRYYAVYNWFKLQNKDNPAFTGRMVIAEHPTFVAKFDKLFEKSIVGLTKKHRVPFANVAFIKDCGRDTVWRMPMFEAYKKSRDDRLSTFDPSIFRHVYDFLLPSLANRYGVQMYEYACAEADDIISVFSRKMQQVCSASGRKIVIITNDNDYLQLIDDSTCIYNLKDVDLKERLKGKTPEVYLRAKILMGDKSDNIPSVFPKCGEKTAVALANNAENLAKMLAKSEAYEIRHKLNTTLIDMACIPAEIQTGILSDLVIAS